MIMKLGIEYSDGKRAVTKQFAESIRPMVEAGFEVRCTNGTITACGVGSGEKFEVRTTENLAADVSKLAADVSLRSREMSEDERDTRLLVRDMTRTVQKLERD